MLVLLVIDLIRHVKVVGQPALYGCTDVAPVASDNSRLLKYLVGQQKTAHAYQSIICSPLRRCQLLATEFSQLCQLPLELSVGLQEMNFGCFDDIPFEGVHFDAKPLDSVLLSEVPVNSIAVKEVGLEKVPGDEVLSCGRQGHNISNQEQYFKQAKAKAHWSQLEAFFQAPAEVILPQAEALADFHSRVMKAWQNVLTQQVAIATEQAANFHAKPQGPLAKKMPAVRRVLVIVHGGVIRMILAHILQLDWQQASWYQKLQIGHGSLSRICISQPYQDKNQAQHLYPQAEQPLHQQVTTIAMPLLEDF
ncbi:MULTISPECIES: histidine phosphatase family protein [Colwellia]|uniref:Alpha-ribazole phosphatase n=1 Tax=Colwellia marinimaniae TaxID=1513592 RepID=A0ABQ0MSP1_9GAMM|nr:MULTISPECIES: histidine phosphatase family protein [Colwellia]GAW95374.1 alpha-ribazole phosphatase [Colwellia marinimaniae]